MGVSLLFLESIRYTVSMNTEEQKTRLKQLYNQVDDYFIKMYMDIESEYALEAKIAVLEQLLSGKKPPEIAEYDDVLDAYPSEEAAIDDLEDVLNQL